MPLIELIQTVRNLSVVGPSILLESNLIDLKGAGVGVGGSDRATVSRVESSSKIVFSFSLIVARV